MLLAEELVKLKEELKKYGDDLLAGKVRPL